METKRAGESSERNDLPYAITEPKFMRVSLARAIPPFSRAQARVVSLVAVSDLRGRGSEICSRVALARPSFEPRSEQRHGGSEHDASGGAAGLP